jgi:hypothetical protein
MRKDSIKIVRHIGTIYDNLAITFEVLVNGNTESTFSSRSEAEEYAKDWAEHYSEYPKPMTMNMEATL